MKVIQFLVIVFGVMFTALQIREINNQQLSRQSKQSVRIFTEVTNKESTKVYTAISSSKPILVSDGGGISEDELELYLNHLHDIGTYTEKGLLNPGLACDDFYDIVTTTWKNSYIQNYLARIRKIDPEYYYGLDMANDQMQSCK